MRTARTATGGTAAGRSTLRVRLGAVAVAALVLTGAAACSDDDAPQAQPSPAATLAPTLDQSQLDALTAGASATLTKRLRIFERCDADAVTGYGFNGCWPKTAPGAAAAGEFAAALRAAGPPPAYARVVTRLDRLAAAGPVVRKACRGGDDQKCDNALMRFRNDTQQVEWELDLL